MSGTEEDILKAARSGDHLALERVWQKHRPWVAALLAARSAKTSEVEDLLSEVALTLVRRIHQVENAMTFRGWLRQVALNTIREFARRQQRRDDHEARAVAIGAGSQTPALPRRSGDEAITQCVDALSQLPLEQREALMLRAVDGLSLAEIANILEVSRSAVESRLSRARATLRRRLQAALEEPS